MKYESNCVKYALLVLERSENIRRLQNDQMECWNFESKMFGTFRNDVFRT